MIYLKAGSSEYRLFWKYTDGHRNIVAMVDMKVGRKWKIENVGTASLWELGENRAVQKACKEALEGIFWFGYEGEEGK